MKFYSEEAQEILLDGGRLQKYYWREDTWIIRHGVWIFRTLSPFGTTSKERLRLDGVDYVLYPLSINSIMEDPWKEVGASSNFAGFGLDSF